MSDGYIFDESPAEMPMSTDGSGTEGAATSPLTMALLVAVAIGLLIAIILLLLKCRNSDVGGLLGSIVPMLRTASSVLMGVTS